MRVEYPKLPVAFMNQDHDHAAEQLETMSTVLSAYPYSREPLAQACRAFLEHNRAHFAREEAAMQSSAFPAFAVHKGEHDRVLLWLESLTEVIEAGLDIETIAQAIEHDIPAWFVRHVQTMDWATANWIANHAATSSMGI